MAGFADLIKSKGRQDKVPFWDMTMQHYGRYELELVALTNAMLQIRQNPSFFVGESIEIMAHIWDEIRPLIKDHSQKDEKKGKVDVKKTFDDALDNLRKELVLYDKRVMRGLYKPKPELMKQIREFRRMLLQEVQEVVGIRRGHKQKDFGDFDKDALVDI